MKNSDKFKLFILITVLLYGFYIIGLNATLIILFILLSSIYFIFNLGVYDDMPSSKKGCYEYFNETHWTYKITITYWWNRFMFYLDYELNKNNKDEEKI